MKPSLVRLSCMATLMSVIVVSTIPGAASAELSLASSVSSNPPISAKQHAAIEAWLHTNKPYFVAIESTAPTHVTNTPASLMAYRTACAKNQVATIDLLKRPPLPYSPMESVLHDWLGDNVAADRFCQAAISQAGVLVNVKYFDASATLDSDVTYYEEAFNNYLLYLNRT